MNIEAEVVSLIARRDWLALATTAGSGAAASSYVPFVVYDDSFAIAISRLSAHTAHLNARPAASLLLVGEPSRDGDAFARPRVSVEVTAQFAPPGTREAGTIWNALAKRFGVIVATLRELPDFQPVLLAPARARFILGFAAAGDLDASAMRRVLRAAARVTEAP